MTKTLLLAPLCALPLLASAAMEPSLARAIRAIETAAPAAPLQIADLSRRAAIRDIAIAPDGRLLAWLEADAQGTALKTMEAASPHHSAPAGPAGQATSARTLGQFGPRAGIAWARDASAVFVDNGDALSAVDARTGAVTRLADLGGPRKRTFLMADPVRSHHALVSEQDANGWSLQRIGTSGGTETMYTGAKLDQFLLAPDGTLAFGQWTATDGQTVLARRTGSTWTDIAHCPQFEPCTLVSANAGGTELNVLATIDGDRRGLAAIDTATGKRRTVFDDPARMSDAMDIVQHPYTGAPQLVRLMAPRRHVASVGTGMRTEAADISRRFGDSNVAVHTSTGPWLIEEYGPRTPQPRYWLYDPARHTFKDVLSDVRAAGKPLDEAALASTVPVSYRARDGVTVHGYLTLPPGRKVGEVPLLTMVHGGPWARVDYSFSSLTQLVASRGVAVFAPNYRASTGHGAAYMRAPAARFGNGTAQSDIIDGVRWLQAQGIGDPKRLAIMGDSFGGYSTLLALANEPTLFQFGMAMSPPVDFAPVVRSLAAQVPVEAARIRYVGLDPDNAAALDAVSADAPAAHAQLIQRPLYLIAGGKDDKVAPQSVRDFAQALHARGAQVTLVLDPDEGHFPRKPLAREGYVYALEGLMHRHFGTAAPAAPSPALADYLKKTTAICCAVRE